MTRAADDFEMIRQAIETLNNLYPVKAGEPDALAAFNRLFTPRPLRELVAEGWTRFQTWPDGDIMEYVHNINGDYLALVGIRGQRFFHEWEDYPCTPIHAPQDMGAK